ncbi:spore germination protein [Paenibacillus aceris]|uniref:spore germination protein n=1 Tax=Paenibacillus aceris TaxID=869555 RepID=UPI0014219B1E|nr:spore germination protein [Paenibacillus aceris]
MKFLFKRRLFSNTQENELHTEHHQSGILSASLTKNIACIDAIFSNTPDLTVRFLEIKQTGKQAVLIYLEGLTDKNVINNHVIRPLINDSNIDGDAHVTVGHVMTAIVWSDVEDAILHGMSALFVDGRAEAQLFDTQGWPQRAIEDPKTEASLRGAHQGFVETSSQNIAMIRRYIPNRELKIKELIVGRRGKTKISILYLEDVANVAELHELEHRIKKLNIDSILYTGELNELIEDNYLSPFPQFMLTERPDVTASHILQGRLAVIVDRSSSALIGPTTFTSYFQSADDYSTRWLVASFIRLQRFIGFLIAIFLPSFYIAVISFNYEVIPIKLLLSIGESRGQVPFPPFIEALIMEFAIEMLREAAIRLPQPIGQTVGIVGGIVIGQAAVQAGIVSNIMVIVVALTAIASFILPNYDMASGIRLIRFPMMLLSALFGFFGIVMGIVFLLAHLISLESLGTPFGSPLAPLRIKDLKDTFFRVPLWKLTSRPKSTNPLQPTRLENNHSKDDSQ